MKGYSRELYMKVLLILVSEAVAFTSITYVSRNVVEIPHSALSSIVAGALLAILVVALYDKWLSRRKQVVREELSQLADAALMRYHLHEDHHDKDKS